MKTNLLILTTVVLASLLTGCDSRETADNPPATNASSTLQSAKDMANSAVTNTVNGASEAWVKVKESFHSAMGDTYDHKDEFVAKTKADLGALDDKIKDLSDRAANAADSAKVDLQAKIDELKAQRPALDQKLAKVQAATAADWDSAKTDFEDAFDKAWDGTKAAWHDTTGN